MQVVVYAGAIMVLFLFVIMYLNLGRDVESGVTIVLRRGLGWLLGAALVRRGRAAGLAAGWPSGRWRAGATRRRRGAGNTQQIGLLLYSRYLFPFEITSIILLVAMIGAIVIARGRRGRRPSRPPRRTAPGEDA